MLTTVLVSGVLLSNQRVHVQPTHRKRDECVQLGAL